VAKKILIPIAREGIKESNIDDEDIGYYLNIIQKLITTAWLWAMANSSNRLLQTKCIPR
jgi:hypothetical protein